MDNAKIQNDLLSILSGLFIDIGERLGKSYDNDLRCDLDRITLSCKSRGLQVFLVDFPSICNGLESSLEIGNNSGMLGLPFTKNGRLTILSMLYTKIFHDSGELLVEPCIEAIKDLRQVLKFAKKFEIDCPADATKEKYLEFAKIEQDLIPPICSWGSDYLSCRGGFPHLSSLGLRLHANAGGGNELSDSEATLWGYSALERIQCLADRFSRSIKFRASWFKPKHGPGAVSEQFELSKFEFPTWPYRLESVFPFDLNGMVNHQIWDDRFPIDHSQPAKLIGVPKDYRGPRLIASEPISSQFIQQGIMRVLRENVKRSPLRHCLDFQSQEPSRIAALSASEDRRFSTIDLSSASDRLSCAVVECIFRRNYSFLEILNAARTPDILYPDGRVEQLKKFAAQGAAFTFPIQSIVYSIICMGVISHMTGETRLSELAKYVRVYGDDMIVPTYCYQTICDTLEALQLRVNRKKILYIWILSRELRYGCLQRSGCNARQCTYNISIV
jgi:hypothetical protein